MFSTACSHRSRHRGHRRSHMMKTTGNSAFDTYKADTLHRLEEEQAQFEDFLGRLRDAKDKAEFDEFMSERAKAAKASDDEAA